MAIQIEIPQWGSNKRFGVSKVGITASTRTKTNDNTHSYEAAFTALLDPVTIDIPAGTSGLISFFITLQYKIVRNRNELIDWAMSKLQGIDVPQINAGTAHYLLEWTYDVTPEGELRVGKATSPNQFWKSDVAMNLDIWTWKDEDNKKEGPPFLKVKIGLTVAESSQPSVSLGYGPGSVNLPNPYEGDAGTLDPLQINLNVVNVKKPPASTLSHTVFFKTGDDHIDRLVKEPNGIVVDQGKAIDDWVNRVISTKDSDTAIRKGYVAVYVAAHASPPWKAAKTPQEVREKDQDLSNRRRDAVMTRLRARWPNAKYDASSAGLSQAKVQGSEEERCDIVISGADLSKGVAKVKAEEP